jgi:hypothetical protein
MSALDQARTFRVVRSMSALPPKADIYRWLRDAQFLPKAEVDYQSPMSDQISNSRPISMICALGILK